MIYIEIWDTKKGKHIEMPKEILDFINDIISVYHKHGLSLAHEDIGGCFEIQRLSDENIEWLKNAYKDY